MPCLSKLTVKRRTFIIIFGRIKKRGFAKYVTSSSYLIIPTTTVSLSTAKPLLQTTTDTLGHNETFGRNGSPMRMFRCITPVNLYGRGSASAKIRAVCFECYRSDNTYLCHEGVVLQDLVFLHYSQYGGINRGLAGQGTQGQGTRFKIRFPPKPQKASGISS